VVLSLPYVNFHPLPYFFRPCYFIIYRIPGIPLFAAGRDPSVHVPGPPCKCPVKNAAAKVRVAAGVLVDYPPDK
jgi:hypothetical protein